MAGCAGEYRVSQTTIIPTAAIQLMQKRPLTCRTSLSLAGHILLFLGSGVKEVFLGKEITLFDDSEFVNANETASS